jgi:hypothetical protein
MEALVGGGGGGRIKDERINPFLPPELGIQREQNPLGSITTHYVDQILAHVARDFIFYFHRSERLLERRGWRGQVRTKGMGRALIPFL